MSDTVQNNQSNLPFIHETDTQYKNWSFEEEELDILRQELNNQAKELFQEIGTQVDYLQSEDELKIIDYYRRAIQEVWSMFHFPKVIMYTAQMYFKRYYLKATLIEYNPFIIAITCLYLATKTENCFIHLSIFTSIFQSLDADTIIEHEFLVAQTLNFDFAIHHPFKPLHGALLDYLAYDESKEEEIMSIYKHAKNLLEISYRSDALFLMQPSQLALATFLYCSKVSSFDFESYLKFTFGVNYEPLIEILNVIIDRFVEPLSLLEEDVLYFIPDISLLREKFGNSVDPLKELIQSEEEKE